jgi:hypothetical protein
MHFTDSPRIFSCKGYETTHLCGGDIWEGAVVRLSKPAKFSTLLTDDGCEYQGIVCSRWLQFLREKNSREPEREASPNNGTGSDVL